MGFMHTLYASAREDIKHKVTCLQNHALTCDNWTSSNNEAYTAVTAHGISNEWEMKEYTIAVQNIQVKMSFKPIKCITSKHEL